MLKEFMELDAWKEARRLVNNVYSLTSAFPFANDYGLKDQIQRAAVSIMSNIAEGSAAKSNIEFMRFLTIARRSSNEVQSLLFVALDQEYIGDNDFKDTIARSAKVSQIINGLIRYLRERNERTSKRDNE